MLHPIIEEKLQEEQQGWKIPTKYVNNLLKGEYTKYYVMVRKNG